jgi:hypothetical protein
MQNPSENIGACQAILSGISTRIDGSVTIKLDINPDNRELISNLMALWATNERAMTVAFVRELNA